MVIRDALALIYVALNTWRTVWIGTGVWVVIGRPAAPVCVAVARFKWMWTIAGIAVAASISPGLVSASLLRVRTARGVLTVPGVITRPLAGIPSLSIVEAMVLGCAILFATSIWTWNGTMMPLMIHPRCASLRPAAVARVPVGVVTVPLVRVVSKRPLLFVSILILFLAC